MCYRPVSVLEPSQPLMLAMRALCYYNASLAGGRFFAPPLLSLLLLLVMSTLLTVLYVRCQARPPGTIIYWIAAGWLLVVLRYVYRYDAYVVAILPSVQCRSLLFVTHVLACLLDGTVRWCPFKFASTLYVIPMKPAYVRSNPTETVFTVMFYIYYPFQAGRQAKQVELAHRHDGHYRSQA